MNGQDFAAFVESQQDIHDSETQWIDIRDEWLKDLNVLYDRISGFLQEFISRGLISCEFVPVMLSEDNIGTYSAPRMDIKIGRKTIVLEPIGTFIVACKGRVDVVGATGRRQQLLLVSRKVRSAADLISFRVNLNGRPISAPIEKEPVTWAWKIVAHEPQGRFIDLDQDSFSSVLVAVASE